jgi:hypothetical protein
VRGIPANPFDAVVQLRLTASWALDFFEVVLMRTTLLNPFNFIVRLIPVGHALRHVVVVQQNVEKSNLKPEIF